MGVVYLAKKLNGEKSEMGGGKRESLQCTICDQLHGVPLHMSFTHLIQLIFSWCSFFVFVRENAPFFSRTSTI